MTSPMLISSVVTAVLVASLATGCSKESDAKQQARQKPAVAAAAPAAPQSPATNPQVKTIYQARCLACHGASGVGDGAGALALEPKPRNLTDPAWQASVTDEQIRKAILEGGASVGKSPTMPAHADLASKREVVDGLVALVRSYKRTL